MTFAAPFVALAAHMLPWATGGKTAHGDAWLDARCWCSATDAGARHLRINTSIYALVVIGQVWVVIKPRRLAQARTPADRGRPDDVPGEAFRHTERRWPAVCWKTTDCERARGGRRRIRCNARRREADHRNTAESRAEQRQVNVAGQSDAASAPGRIRRSPKTM
jgi:hypothetical protein